MPCYIQYMGARPASEEVFDPRERAAEKEARRERDRHDLASGRVTVDELRRRNGALSAALKGARIDLSRTPSVG